jgi:hypothetical protein
MRFPMPHFPCEFEIPDDWLSEANALSFAPERPAYRAPALAEIVPLTKVEPPPRLVGYPLSWRGLDRTRFISVLVGMVADAEIDPVPVVEMPYIDLGSSPYEFRVRDGVHRFYASVAMGYLHLPLERVL